MKAKMYRSINIVVFIALFALVTESQARATDNSSKELIPQIKVTSIEVPYINPEYVKDLNFTIIKHNATYNKYHINWEIIQDLPADVQFTMSVYATDSEYKNEKRILHEIVPLCKHSPKRELLPDILRLPESRLQDCIKKGLYIRDNPGAFRFDILLPNIHKISDYHYIRYITSTGDETICEAKFYSEWGYLNGSDE